MIQFKSTVVATFFTHPVSAGSFCPSKRSNSSLVVMAGPSDFTSIIWFQCSEKEWIGVAALMGFTVLFNVLLYINREMEIMKVSCQSNAVGGTSNKVEDEIAVK
ncbi:hypothetical protein EZV62_003765 [Acer yangbiense]|uniref:Plant PDR ABC transporter associated domain-containing protein n=1 Tax=Acer yangbiense TaxID=1000413 RepID=A0A5C7IHP5_9ROSI|nr:hypothetical protein EZV62_003765 [Acer yangbiense]